MPSLPFDPIAEAMDHWRGHGWGEASRGMGVVTSVIRVEQILSGRAEDAVRPFGLTFARYEVLMLLLFSSRGELPLGKIGQRLQVGAASVTNAIDRLERDRLVRRRANPEDGRGVLAAITRRGRQQAEKATDGSMAPSSPRWSCPRPRPTPCSACWLPCAGEREISTTGRKAVEGSVAEDLFSPSKNGVLTSLIAW